MNAEGTSLLELSKRFGFLSWTRLRMLSKGQSSCVWSTNGCATFPIAAESAFLHQFVSFKESLQNISTFWHLLLPNSNRGYKVNEFHGNFWARRKMDTSLPWFKMRNFAEPVCWSVFANETLSTVRYFPKASSCIFCIVICLELFHVCRHFCCWKKDRRKRSVPRVNYFRHQNGNVHHRMYDFQILRKIMLKEDNGKSPNPGNVVKDLGTDPTAF